MLYKKAKSHLSPVNYTPSTSTNTFVPRGLGAILLAISLSVFTQGVPLMFVFIGAYLGVPADAKVGNMDTMVWLLTSVTMMFLVLYGFISWMKFLWRRFITNPVPLHLFKKKEKHAQ
jgi:hypothetical protein